MKKLVLFVAAGALGVFAALVWAGALGIGRSDVRRFNVYVSGVQPFTVEAARIVSEGSCTVYKAKHETRICVSHVAVEVVPGAPTVAQPQPTPGR